MKKVRKSLIVLPAIATLALTTVASVAGTAAWFIQSTTATVTGSMFTAEVLNGSLKVATETNEWAGTSGGNATALTSNQVIVDGHLGDASWNYTNLYYAVTNGDQVTGFVKAGDGIPTKSGTLGATNSPWYQGTNPAGGAVWRAVSWKMTFTSDAVSGSSSAKVAVMLDPVRTKFSVDTKINAGLRIAMQTSDERIVYANDGSNDHVDKEGVFSVDVTEESLKAKFDADNEFIGPDDTTPRLSDYADGLATSKYYLGTLDSTHTSLEVTCVAWYEGTDAKVIIDQIDNAEVTATLTFYGANTK